MGLRESFDRANPNTLADQFRLIKLGQTLRQDMKTTIRHANPDVAAQNPFDLATHDIIVLPDDAKAGTLLRVFAKAGAGAVGERVIAARHATPAAGQAAITPAGNLAFLIADAYTDVDIEYIPERGDVVEITLPVVAATGNMALPTFLQGHVLVLIEAAAVLPAAANKIVLAPAAAAVAAGRAALAINQQSIWFAVADAVTSARVKLLVDAEADLNALLESDAAETL